MLYMNVDNGLNCTLTDKLTMFKSQVPLNWNFKYLIYFYLTAIQVTNF